MTKIWLMSDLHQEFVDDKHYGGHALTRFEPMEDPPEDFDVVVLAGDIASPLTNSVKWAHERFAGIPTILVCGNHEAFNPDDGSVSFTLEEALEAGRELAGKLGIHLLENDTVELDGTRFIGATLWTDFATVGRGNMVHKERHASGRQGMNDYKRIKRFSSADPSKRKRLRPQDTIARHRESRAYIEAELAKPFDGPRIVVTHHAPHPNSLPPMGDGRDSELDYCYASNLSLLLESENAPDAWLHGHLHTKLLAHREYRVGNTLVVTNARGYQFEEKQQNDLFQPKYVLDTEELKPRAGPTL